jgi:twitching motility protein PilT
MEGTLSAVLETGVQAGASDWYIRETSPVTLRVDGKLVTISDFEATREFMLDAISEIVSEESLDTYRQKGDANFALQADGIGRFRVNLFRQRGQMAMVLRHVKDKVPDREDLHLPETIHDIAHAPRGIIFITGTTGSGKSTTLASMVEYLNTHESRHIITVEDPIEYTFQDKLCVIDQREVGIDTESFSSALINALRQDPDIIIIGEMRDRQGFDAALQAADTGHVVITTLHTTNASQTIQRILDFYPEQDRRQIRQALADSLYGIVSQRLMPRAVGKGVVPAIEIMLNNTLIAKLLRDNELGKLGRAIEASTEDGMMSFNQYLMKLVNDGMITEETALVNANNPEALKMMLKGIYLHTDGGILGE